jgi:hypothetical protein
VFDKLRRVVCWEPKSGTDAIIEDTATFVALAMKAR